MVGGFNDGGGRSRRPTRAGARHSSFVVAMIGAYAAAATGIEPSRVLAQG